MRLTALTPCFRAETGAACSPPISVRVFGCGSIRSLSEWKESGDGDFLQRAALNFAGGTFRQIGKEQYSFGGFVIRQARSCKLDESLLVNSLPLAQGDKRDDPFSIYGMRLADDSRLEHRRVLVERVFHFLRRDV